MSEFTINIEMNGKNIADGSADPPGTPPINHQTKPNSPINSRPVTPSPIAPRAKITCPNPGPKKIIKAITNDEFGESPDQLGQGINPRAKTLPLPITLNNSTKRKAVEDAPLPKSHDRDSRIKEIKFGDQLKIARKALLNAFNEIQKGEVNQMMLW